MHCTKYKVTLARKEENKHSLEQRGSEEAPRNKKFRKKIDLT